MEQFHLGVLAVLGICVAGGVVGAWIFQKLNIPQVVGYIVVGVLIGDTGFGLLKPSDVADLTPFNNFALGLIGFLVGGELSGSIFKKYGKQFTAILMGEGLAAFLLVGLAATGIVFLVCHNWIYALAAGIVFGAIASATDPASTIDVLWEYRSAGVLTTAIVAIVALDDALAMTLYGLGTSMASILMDSGGNVGLTMLHTLIELGGAVVLGVACGFVLNAMMHYMPQTEKRLGISIGIILLCIGVAVAFNMDVILATMTVGIVLINMAPRRSKQLFEVIRSFSTPIYIIFFVLVGARLSLKNMPLWLWGLVAAYVLMRSLGKWVGSYLGARVSKAEKPVQNYMGMALFAQGGVAVGLSIVASEKLPPDILIVEGMKLADMIVFTVTATTLVVQLIGPAFAKLAIKKAGEIGRNVTEEDIMAELKVSDVVDTSIVPLKEGTPLAEVVQHFAEQDTLVYPVIANDEKIVGVLTFEMLKEILLDRDTWLWLVVGDVMQPLTEHLLAETNLAEALKEMLNTQVEALPVVESTETGKLLGVLDQRAARRKVSAELVHRQTATA